MNLIDGTGLRLGFCCVDDDPLGCIMKLSVN